MNSVAGERGVDAAELHPAAVDDRQPVERHPLGVIAEPRRASHHGSP